MLSIREEEYVQALRAFGLNDLVICYKHMLPNALWSDFSQYHIEYCYVYLAGNGIELPRSGVPLNISTWGTF